MNEEKKHGYIVVDCAYEEEEFIGIDYYESEIGVKYEIADDTYLSKVAIVLRPINRS